MVEIKSSPITLMPDEENKEAIIITNSEMRDYEIVYLEHGEKKRWFGSSAALLHSYPTSKIINITKLKK